MADVDTMPNMAPGLPDYVLDPNAVLKDTAAWRYGRAPDYSNTRRVFEETKSKSHEAGSLPDLVQNLVKNWEIEASFKTSFEDWRTVDPSVYTFAINGGPPQSAEHMLKVGTYNAIIAPNQFYSPDNSDFASSHKTFKRMMPTFAWEVLEVYSGPPKVAFRWRHWGTMKSDYVGFNNKGEKVTAPAHGGPIDIQGVTVALVDAGLRVQQLETWFDPLEMFRQISPTGEVTKSAKKAVPGEDFSAALDSEAFASVTTASIIATPTSAPSVQISDISVPANAKVEDLNKLVADLSVALDALKVGLAGKNKTQEIVVGADSSPKSTGDLSWVNVIGGAGPATPNLTAETSATEREEGATTKMTHEEMVKMGAGAGECPFLGKP